MNKSIGKQILETFLFVTVMVASVGIYTADNEIYIDQSGATSNLDIFRLYLSISLFIRKLDPS